MTTQDEHAFYAPNATQSYLNDYVMESPFIGAPECVMSSQTAEVEPTSESLAPLLEVEINTDSISAEPIPEICTAHTGPVPNPSVCNTECGCSAQVALKSAVRSLKWTSRAANACPYNRRGRAVKTSVSPTSVPRRRAKNGRLANPLAGLSAFMGSPTDRSKSFRNTKQLGTSTTAAMPKADHPVAPEIDEKIDLPDDGDKASCSKEPQVKVSSDACSESQPTPNSQDESMSPLFTPINSPQEPSQLLPNLPSEKPDEPISQPSSHFTEIDDGLMSYEEFEIKQSRDSVAGRFRQGRQHRSAFKPYDKRTDRSARSAFRKKDGSKPTP